MSLRLIFMGTPDFAVPTLLALHAAGHEIVAAYTREAKPAGRGMKLQPTPIEAEARRLGIPVFTPKTLKTSEAEAEFRAHNADAAVVVAYGMILPQAILDAPRLGCFNLHGSLLPRWRGAAPIQRAIMSGDPKSGIEVMKMNAGLDTGDVAKTRGKRVVQIADSTTAQDLHDALKHLGASLMVSAVNQLETGKIKYRKQDEAKATYADKINKKEAKIDWTKSAHHVLHQIHGLSPFPGAWFEVVVDDELIRIKALRCELAKGKGPPGDFLDDRFAIACGENAIRLLKVQRAGKQPMSASDCLRGLPLKPPLRVVLS